MARVQFLLVAELDTNLHDHFASRRILLPDADFFRARNSAVMSSFNINTARSANVSTLYLKQRTITFPGIANFQLARILSSIDASSSASGLLRWIEELDEDMVALKGSEFDNGSLKDS